MKLRQAIEQCAASPDTCVYPADLPRSDYDFRTKLPIHNGAVGSWIALQTAKANLVNAQSSLSSTPQIIFTPSIKIVSGGGIGGGIKATEQRTPNPAYTWAQQKVQQAEKAVQRAMSALDSTQERFQLWIELPSRERCDNEESDVCINNTQLDAIRRSPLSKRE